MLFVLLQFLFNIGSAPMLFLGIGKKRLASACLQIDIDHGDHPAINLERFKALVHEWKKQTLPENFADVPYTEQVELLSEIAVQLQAKTGLAVAVNAYSFHPMIPVIPEEVWSAEDIAVSIEDFAASIPAPDASIVTTSPEDKGKLVDVFKESRDASSALDYQPIEMNRDEYTNRREQLLSSAEDMSSPEYIKRNNEERRIKYNKGKDLLEVGLLTCEDRQDMEALMKKVVEVSDGIFDTFALEYDRDRIVKIVDPFSDDNVDNLNDFLSEVKRTITDKVPNASEELDDFSFTTGVCACMAVYDDYKHPVIPMHLWVKSH